MNEQRSCGLSSGVEFKNLAYKVQLGYKKGYKEILKSINGRFPSNKLIGILGGSGSGKSTLLNLLSGYEEGKYSGTIRTYGVDEDLKQYRKKSVYIMQDNYLQDLLTLRENMEIAADLKLGDRFGCYAKKAIIDKVISVMGLKDAIDTKTGILSGGEKKRLSVGLELINEPSILFLDEPTTGLDSSACTQFMEHLKELTVEGKTIICTIHQPSATVFNLFDEIYILQDGSCFYRGKPEDLLPCLENNGWTCPLFHNPADFAIELSINNVNIVQESVWECEEEVTKDEPCNTNKVDISDVSEYYSFKVLMKREFLKCIRNKTLTYLRLITSVMNSLTLSVIFWKIPTRS
ncbi:PREDICTED: ATP-binding cassette sub-family G member 1-like isoform X2 [Nicrophorus vespilloides]|uniref:ATP-binding cassette sub-family G member 1-like isoform X2 n=1 Tax=Nicrophorus vespilloides TaxID=110193 RepID=A0ABM1NGA0_NICVS|nr:PREDICTED: ATP-binding cassette sub-family G member 1-like isoform X2 [Nicrophorus vespilloides]